MNETKELFKRAKLYSFLDLALVVPSSYNDTTLSQTLAVGKSGVFEAKVIQISTQNGKLLVTFQLVKFNQKVQSLFFRTTPYHYQKFTQGSSHYIQGKIELFGSTLQIKQPKSIKNIGEITPNYSVSIKQDEIRKLITAYLSTEQLLNEGLLPNEAKRILELHFPRSLEDISNNDKSQKDTLSVLKFVEAYNHIKKLSAKKTTHQPMESLTGDITAFIEKLPFSLTDEQLAVIEEIQQDLSSKEKAAKRMIVGDVGSGKTMVILAAAMMAYPSTTLLMAPTSLLALQLYEEALKYLPKNLRIALVMQGKEQGEYKSAHFIIGTHALLYKEELPQAPLIIIDEQHRFGTNQRHKLESLGSSREESSKRAHYLQFSATPIPRTQAMINSALVDVSLITKTPFQKSITTLVIGKNDFTNLLKDIKSEILKKHQVLIVYPLVEESETIDYQSLAEARRFWEERFDNVYVTHGKDSQKEKTLLEFRQKGDILLATTVVEVGISLPKLTIIVIVGAERLGLATLHQLRGRVGRLGLESRCYLFTKQISTSRLKAFASTVSGFEIAKLDLQYRESGDILEGTIQSGQKFKWLDLATDEEIIANAQKRLKSKNEYTHA